VLLALLFLGCQTPASEGADSTAIPSDTGACPPGGTTHTWDNFGRQFFVDWCVVCHNREAPAPGVPPDSVFDDEAYVWSVGPAILDRVVNTTPASAPRMPPPAEARSAELETREIVVARTLDLERLVEWLNCGAPSGD